MPRIFIAIALLGLIVSTASAQIIYEPVQSQYTAGGTTYYYGGSDPRVHAFAKQPYSASGTWGRVNGYAFASGNINTYREVSNEPVRVFTDSVGLVNAHMLGFTPNDASNEAYANMPRYFVKRDLLRAAVPQRDGSWVVPAQAQPVRIFKSNGTEVTPAPSTMPRPLLIIPKDQLIRPEPKPSDKQLVMAQN